MKRLLLIGALVGLLVSGCVTTKDGNLTFILFDGFWVMETPNGTYFGYGDTRFTERNGTPTFTISDFGDHRGQITLDEVPLPLKAAVQAQAQNSTNRRTIELSGRWNCGDPESFIRLVDNRNFERPQTYKIDPSNSDGCFLPDTTANGIKAMKENRGQMQISTRVTSTKQAR